MSSDNEEMRKLIERFEALPVVCALRQRYDFQAVLVVQTEPSVDFYEARAYSLSGQMQGRVSPQRTRQGYQWFFELDEDGVQFAFKFAKSLAKRLPPAAP